MRKPVFTLLTLTLLWMTGCSPAQPQPSQQPKPGQTTVSTENPNKIPSRANMYIKRVDGKIVTTYWAVDDLKKITLEPGEHKIHVAFNSGEVIAEKTIEHTLQAGHKYDIYALKTGALTFKVYLADVSGTQARVLHATDVRGHAGLYDRNGNLNAIINKYTIKKKK